jgi:hypothetical protein
LVNSQRKVPSEKTPSPSVHEIKEFLSKVISFGSKSEEELSGVEVLSEELSTAEEASAELENESLEEVPAKEEELAEDELFEEEKTLGEQAERPKVRRTANAK